MRLLVPFTFLAAGLACKAPIDFNTTPQITFVDIESGVSVPLGEPLVVELRVTDEDGDTPITVTLESDLDQLLGTRTDVGATEVVRFEGLLLSGGTHTLTATADDGRDDGEQSVTLTLLINEPPSTPVLMVAPENPTPADDLVGTLVEASIDPEGSEVGYAWEWRREGLTFLTGSSFPAVLPGSQTGVNDVWTLWVEAFESAGGARIDGGSSSTSTLDITILNNPPTAPDTVDILPSSPHPLQDLRCEASGASDPDGETLSYTYRWEFNDGTGFVPVAGLVDAILPASETSAGDQWRCVAAAFDGAQSGPEESTDLLLRANLDSLGNADNTLTGFTNDFGRQSAIVDEDNNGTADSILATDPAASSDAGAAYVFSSGLVTSTPGIDPGDAFATLTGAAGDRLGESVRVSGDVTGDGVHEVLLSANGTANGYVAALDVTRLTASTGIVPAASFSAQVQSVDPGSFSGMAAGDFDDDGRAELAITLVPDSGTNSIVVVPDAALTIGATVLSDQGGAVLITQTTDDETIGAQLRADADLTGDGVVDLYMSGLRDQSNNVQTAALVFDSARALAGGTESDALIAIEHNIGPSGTPTDAGTAIATLPDMSGDGVSEMSLGAPGSFSDRGRVGIFAGNLSAPTVLAFADFEHAVAIEGEEAGDRFGTEILVLGDLGSDGIPELAISAPGAANGAGKVYIFEGAALQTAMMAGVAGGTETLSAADAGWVLAGSSATSPVAVPSAAGDLDGDGYADLMIWAPDTATGFGRLHVYLSDR